MSRSGFLNKLPVQGIFRGPTSRPIAWLFFFRGAKDFLSKAFHLTLFRGNCQNETELKPN